jgi:hypothetical protein
MQGSAPVRQEILFLLFSAFAPETFDYKNPDRLGNSTRTSEKADTMRRHHPGRYQGRDEDESGFSIIPRHRSGELDSRFASSRCGGPERLGAPAAYQSLSARFARFRKERTKSFATKCGKRFSLSG